MKKIELTLKRKITKVGGSLGVIIPKVILETLNKGMGDDVEIKITVTVEKE